MIENEIYESVNDIYLDYNRIRSIDILGDSNFLMSFRLLDLKGNKLTKVS